jgi:hypothetical protein
VNAIPPHIAITYQPKPRYAPLERETPPATEDLPMPNPAPLSPAAQAVLDAFYKELPPDNRPGGLAAALRAATDHGEYLYDSQDRLTAVVRVADLEAWAAELEAQL